MAPTRALALLLFACILLSTPAAAQRNFTLPDTVHHTPVDIWSEGTRMAGDLYRPADAPGDARLPAIVMSHGWGGTKAGLRRNAAIFAADGFVVLAFDYRGWGESDGKLVVVGDMPEPNADGKVQVMAQEIRTVVDPIDQALDIRRAVDFIEGEANVDLDDIEPYAREQAIRRARGEIAPLPQGTDKAPNLNGWAHLDKVLEYRPVNDAHRITIPLLVIDAENEELFDRHQSGELAVERAKANGARAEYRVIPEISHYGIYREAFDESARMALDWFNDCLKE